MFVGFVTNIRYAHHMPSLDGADDIDDVCDGDGGKDNDDIKDGGLATG